MKPRVGEKLTAPVSHGTTSSNLIYIEVESLKYKGMMVQEKYWKK